MSTFLVDITKHPAVNSLGWQVAFKGDRQDVEKKIRSYYLNQHDPANRILLAATCHCAAGWQAAQQGAATGFFADFATVRSVFRFGFFGRYGKYVTKAVDLLLASV